MSFDYGNYILHYGIKRRSGRYPWGSGENPYQHEGDFLSRVDKMKNDGMSEKEIADYFEMNVTELRACISLAKSERRADQIATAQAMHERGASTKEIADSIGVSESTVRNMLSGKTTVKADVARSTADLIISEIEKKGIVDVGAGVELELGCSKSRLDQALIILASEGYPVYKRRIAQVTNPGKYTTLVVACPQGTEYGDIYHQPINSLKDYISYDGGDTYKKSFEYPASMDSSRLAICYTEDGGKEKDGVIEIRRNVEDLDLGNSSYAQVRILVDGTHYLKGMAVYSDDLPEGIDIRFNTNKSSDVDKMDVLKKIGSDPDNPFGSLIKEHGGQSYYISSETGEEKLSLINKTREEGDWNEWDKTLASQFLSKQSKKLIEQQLYLTEQTRENQYEQIMLIENPTLRKVMLEEFAEDCDAAAVHLKAAALPRQSTKVILPSTTLGDTEIYAPSYNNGEKVALVRYPHGGIFEIPILTVNNNNAETKATYGNAKDAVAINATVAAQLSGADYDGDTVVVIPITDKSNIQSMPYLEELKNFDPKMEYGTVQDADGNYINANGDKVTIMSESYKQQQMGVVSNLITDMTLKGAPPEEIAKAVRHSMVVIDAVKHHLDYKQSAKDNDIEYLRDRYQGYTDPETGNTRHGAATLISRASAEVDVDRRRGYPDIDPDTGELHYKTAYDSDLYYVDENGVTKKRTQKSTQMAETSDAYLLSSGTVQEQAYAEYANKMKALANRARKASLVKDDTPYSTSAAETYAKEVL